MPAGRGPCGHVHRYRAIACSNMAGAGHNQAPGRAHMWTMWTMQKQIVHMVHMHAPGLFGAGDVWTMWAVWTVVLNRWLIILYTGIVYTFIVFLFSYIYCPHCPQSPFSLARHVGKSWRAPCPQFCPHGPQNCKLIVYIGFCLQHVSD